SACRIFIVYPIILRKYILSEDTCKKERIYRMSQVLATPISSTGTFPQAPTKMMVGEQHLMKSYQHKTVVNDVSFQVKSGEIFGVLGPNGAGKTTTLEMIEGIRTPD